MTAKPYLIANIRTGLERDVQPWLLPNDAFPNLEDCFMYRGRIERRKGYEFLGRLVTFLGLATGASFSGTIPNSPITPFTVFITVAVAGGTITFFDDGAGVLIGNPGANTGTINYATGAIVLNFVPAIVGNVDVSFANNLPVMGLRTRDLDTPNVNQLIAFDTQKANLFSNSAQLFEDISFYKTTGTAFNWTGSNSQFFWTVNYLGAIWSTNGNFGFQNTPEATVPASGDGIRWYDGTGWVNFLPYVNNAHTVFLMGAQILVSYRNRLVALNTVEGTAYASPINFYQRARWSQNGTPYVASVAPPNQTSDNDAWNSETIGKGGFIDAPTGEEIISAEFYKDTLIVYFEESTWQLRYTGNETLPFVWERINVDFGAESTFSTVPFDGGIISIGNYGIVSCDATGVKRIDQIIPDEVFQFHNGNDGPERVYGIRDYPRQLVYWTFPSSESNTTFPNRVLVYNYLDGSYSFFNDSITCFGTYQSFNDTTWKLLNVGWQNYPSPWNSGVLQADYPQIVAGNQQGFVLNNYNGPGNIANGTSLTITGITQAVPAIVTSVNHNMVEGTIITITDVNGMTQLNGNQYQVSMPITANTFALQMLQPNGSWINVDSTAFTPYAGSGFITIRNNFNVLTKTFNPFISNGDQVRLQWVDLYLETSPLMEFTMNVYLDENDNTPVQFDFVAPTSPTLAKVWERMYVSAIGQFCQLEFTFDNEQMVDEAVSDGDVVIHAMMLWMSDAGRLTYGTIM